MVHTIIHNPQIINTIGREAGIPLWDDLTSEKRGEEYSNDNEKNYFRGIILGSRGIYPPMLVFQQAGHYGYGPGSSIYTINLKTGKPTIQSTIKKVPRYELVCKLYDDGKNVLENYFKKVPS